jgi:predicted peptidase
MVACVSYHESTDATIFTNFTECVETYPTTIWTTVPIEETEVKETEPILFDPNITFEYKYVADDEYMPYGLFIPSTAKDSDTVTLIVWLHGSGEVGANKETFINRGLLKVLNEWSLDGFNAYVLCPHLSGRGNFGNWCNDRASNGIKILLDMMIDNYNVNVDNIIIVGHSLGGYGAEYIAVNLPEYFSKLIVLSGYKANIKREEIIIPTRGYVGTRGYGEDGASVDYMLNTFASVFGEENTFSIESSHADLPNKVFNIDEDEDNCSDVIEWMFTNIN